MPFIKSHSNFVLKNRHQDVSDGTIFERDITTIGGLNQFSKGQTPIYKSGNFIITVRNDGRPSNQYNTSKWKENDSGDTWTLQTISGMVSDYEDQDDTKIVLKQDYYDFRDFAYYGSLTELFRASVTDIVARFPGELYLTNDNAYYTVRKNVDFDKIEESKLLGGEDYFVVSNPFGIDIYTKYLPTGADFLKFFADDGFLNYQVTSSKTETSEDDFVWDDITRWTVNFRDPCDDCSCSNLTVNPTTLEFESDDEEGKEVTIGIINCLSDANVSVKSSPSWATAILGDDNKLTVTVEPSEIKRDGEIVITANNKKTTCETRISVRQKAPIPKCDCDANIETSERKMVFDSNGGTSSFTITVKDTCIDQSTIKAFGDKGWIDVSKNGSKWVVEISSHDADRSGAIKISASTTTGICTVSKIDVSQTNYCQCKDLNIHRLDEDKSNASTNSASNTRMRGGLLRADNNETLSETPEEIYRRFAEITLSTEKYGNIKIYAYLGDDNNVVYLIKGEYYLDNNYTTIYTTKEAAINAAKGIYQKEESETDEQWEERLKTHIHIKNYHIRPRDKFYAAFWNECDNFQKLLINRDNGYKATFSVIRENDFGYYREFVPFIFPKTYGNYNIDATDYGFNVYTTQMVQIGEYYDENFTDNLWRSMTHEAIKNFDWTYTREYQEGDEEEYVLGGQKMQKALRIFAREFDEIISYINNIKNNNRVTYDERSNIPDYFLTDVVENEGWNVKMVYPYSLTEYTVGIRTVVNPETYTESGDCKGQLFNQEGDNIIRREFSQNSNNLVKPYSKSMIDDETEDGYFIVCKGDDCTDINTVEVTNPPIPCTGGTVEVTWKLTKEKGKRTQINTPCEYKCGLDGEEPSFVFVRADGNNTLYDKCALSNKGVVKDRIKSYTDEKEWSYQDANNEFLRRLKINSPYIWRHKGTLEGIDMILGMFGLRNRKWVDSIPDWLKDCKYRYENGELKFDYEVIEYSSFANRIEEPWDVVHQNYRINWINSTKTIIYDNRFISNYTKYGANSNILTYQGIPVQYREAYDNETPYITRDTLENQLKGITPTAESGESFVKMDGTPVRRRFLYPNFDKNEQLDGNPYFQMDGGWLSKKLHVNAENDDSNSWVNFQFDVDDNIVFTDYKEKGELLDNGFLDDNIFLYKETIRNIRRVDNINELLSLPTVELHNGVICSVTSIERNSAVIDGVVYPITTEWSSDSTNGHSVSYISFTKTDGFIKVGKNKFFDTTMMVYDIDGNQYMYDVDGMDDGLVVKAYIKDDGTFMCQEDETGNYSITYFQELEKYYKEEGYTNYFILDDINYVEELARFESDGDASTVSGWTSGWRRLAYGDRDFLKINTITNDYNGNNPHNGNMVYDNGHEYFLYFKRLFKHASENDLFDERCYDDFYRTLDDEIIDYGFNGLVENNDDILQYDDFLVEDSKIHYFGNYKTKNEDNTINEVWIYGQDANRLTGSTFEDEDGEEPKARGGYDKIYANESDNVQQYILNNTNENGWVEDNNPYSELTARTDTIISEETGEETQVPRYPNIDEFTNQIVNNKRLTIRFYLHNKWYTEDGQNELKYIDDIVMNYLTQMIPSTTLLTIEYDLGHVIEEIVTEGKNPPSEGEEPTIETITEVYSSGINCENSIQTIATSTHFESAVTIVQEAGPCCLDPKTEYSFGVVNIGCGAYNDYVVNVPYTAITICEECSTQDEKEDVSAYTISVECNETSSVKTLTSGGSLGNFTIKQAAGPCCCDCDDLKLNPSTPLVWEAYNREPKTVTITPNCTTIDSVEIDSDTYFNMSYDNNIITVSPKQENTTVGSYETRVTIKYKATPTGGTSKSCTAYVNLKQKACECSNATVTISITNTALDPCGETKEVGTYEFLCDACNESNLSFNKTSGIDVSFSFSGGKIVATYNSNTGDAEVKSIGYFQYNGTNVGEQKTFSQGICCNCKSITIKIV